MRSCGSGACTSLHSESRLRFLAASSCWRCSSLPRRWASASSGTVDPARIRPAASNVWERRIKVVANAGGVNLEACRRALAKVAEEAGVSLRIATVEGDNLLDRVDELRAIVAGWLEL